MADITVTNTIKLPGGGAPTKASTVIELVTGSIVGGFLSGIEVLGTQTADVDGTGKWSKTLTPNVGTGAIATPANTYYRVTESADGMTSSYTIQVDGSGSTPKTVDQVLFSPPTGSILLGSALGATFLELSQMTAPASPAATARRLFYDSSDGHLKHKKADGTLVDLDTIGGAITPDVDQNFGTGYFELNQRSAAGVSSPASGKRRVFVDSADGLVKVKRSDGSLQVLTTPAELTMIVWKDPLDGLIKAFRSDAGGHLSTTSATDCGAVFNAAWAAQTGLVGYYQDLDATTALVPPSGCGVIGQGRSKVSTSSPTISANAVIGGALVSIPTTAVLEVVLAFANFDAQASGGAGRAVSMLGTDCSANYCGFRGGSTESAKFGGVRTHLDDVSIGSNGATIAGSDGIWDGGDMNKSSGTTCLTVDTGCNGWQIIGVHFNSSNVGPNILSHGTMITFTGCYFDGTAATASVVLETDAGGNTFDGCIFRNGGSPGVPMFLHKAGSLTITGCVSESFGGGTDWTSVVNSTGGTYTITGCDFLGVALSTSSEFLTQVFPGILPMSATLTVLGKPIQHGVGGQSAIDAEVAFDTTAAEQTAHEFTIKANRAGPKRVYRYTGYFAVSNTSGAAVVYTFKIKLAGTQVNTVSISVPNGTSGAGVRVEALVTVRTVGASGTVIGAISAFQDGASGKLHSPIATVAYDSTADRLLGTYVTMASSAATILWKLDHSLWELAKV